MAGDTQQTLAQRLLTTIYQDGADLAAEVAQLIAVGAPVDDVTEYGESPLRVASNNGRFDVVRALLRAGADPGQLRWTDSFHAVVFGDLADVRNSVARERDLEARDNWSRTPWLLSLQCGDVARAELLLDLGADRAAVGRCGETPMAYAIQQNDTAMLKWLIDEGFDIEASDEFLSTPLIVACELGMTECVRVLVDAGADIFRCNHIPERAIEVATNLDIVNLLVECGDDINDISSEMHADLVGIDHEGAPNVSRDDYVAGKQRRFGTGNPEKIQDPFWHAMIRSGAKAWIARDRFENAYSAHGGPVWSYHRFGRSTTVLQDGRIIEVAGEHEDHYDPDFCIYNDVTIFSPGGEIETFAYPREDFPPTDFHSATLVGDCLLVIGCLGYPDDRVFGHTPVYRLDLTSLRIERMETSGSSPGWISGHKALYDGNSSIAITGGEVMSKSGDFVASGASFRLCLGTATWHRDE